MKKILFLTLMISGVVSFAQELKANLENAKIGFNFIDENTKGTFKGLNATIKFDANNLGSSSISGSVDVSAISTGNKTRDKHLKSGEYFDAVKYPKISFKSTSITKEGSNYKVKGKLKIKNIEKEVEFTFSYSNKTFVGKSSIYSQDFGVWEKGKREKTKVDITIELPVL